MVDSSFNYLPSSKLTVISLLEPIFGLVEEEETKLGGPLLRTKAGFLDTGSVAISLLSMRNALDMVGRSLGSYCTHNNPTFTHLKNSFILHVSLSVWSIRSYTLSSIHNLHAWNSSLECYNRIDKVTIIGQSDGVLEQ